ncbi:YqaJ viral recombinase family nuclease [Gulosibacter molinativorax]|uniref:YqaJ viral recombinase domain-containing protein n=1 Tax=Gulosibacter molinativorax TaxID=256821 RepID=A0ABT7C7B9_9MICO|nr:YqaJ viral recombinase family protein [Gulosibacter molinativorax]MDJ1370664.1 hypothetical protein [Gulosibacter molinativorax]QUY63310.1 Hypotetical protein [Gulosibacter molinativorax]
MSFERLEEYEQDSPEWHEARTHHLGASEVAAVLGLSKWQTPLSVYRTKMGVPNEIPENLAYFGHALEEPIAQWIRDKHPEVGKVWRGMSVRSTEFPWLSATPDRTVRVHTGGVVIPIEIKTSSAYSIDEWADGVPDYYKIQSIVQQGVLGAPYGWLAVLHGGNTPDLHRIEFDASAWELIVQHTRDFWEQHVLTRTPPDPVGLTEQNAVWPSVAGKATELSDEAFDVFERRNVLLSDIKSMQGEADALQEALGAYVEDAETLTYQGRKVATYKTQQGRKRVSVRDLEEQYPDVAEALVTRGSPFKVLRTVKEKQ